MLTLTSYMHLFNLYVHEYSFFFWTDIDRSQKDDYTKNLWTAIFLMSFVTYYFVQLFTEYLAHGKNCVSFWNMVELCNMLFFVLYATLTFMGHLYLEHESNTETIDYGALFVVVCCLLFLLLFVPQ